MCAPISQTPAGPHNISTSHFLSLLGTWALHSSQGGSQIQGWDLHQALSTPSHHLMGFPDLYQPLSGRASALTSKLESTL